VLDVVLDLATPRTPYSLGRCWPEGRWGYDSELAASKPLDALIADAARLLPADWLELLLDGVKGAHTGTRIVPMVDAYTERLGAPPPSYDATLRASLDQLHSDGSGPRRILGRIPAERREALVDGIHFNLYVGPSHPNGQLPYFRQGWHYCDLAPTLRLAEQAAASLAHFVVAVTLQPSERALLDQRIVEGLARRMGAYGEAGRAALATVAPQAKSSLLLQAVLDTWGRGLA
jgi:hypothetical protein